MPGVARVAEQILRGDRRPDGVAVVQRNAALAGCVLGDAEHNALTHEIAGMRFGPPLAACEQVLGARQRAVLRLALSFFAWRTLTREGGLKPGAAVEAMIQAIDGAG
jgi:hypothetical protein